MRTLHTSTNVSSLSNQKKLEDIENKVSELSKTLTETVDGLEEVRTEQKSERQSVITKGAVVNGNTSTTTLNVARDAEVLGSLEAGSVDTPVVDADSISSGSISSDLANIKSARINGLRSDGVTVDGLIKAEVLDADEANIGSFTITDLNVTDANIDTLKSKSTTLDEVNANEVVSKRISSERVSVGSTEADEIRTLDLLANKATISAATVFDANILSLTHKNELAYIRIESPETETGFNIIKIPRIVNGEYRVTFVNNKDEIIFTFALTDMTLFKQEAEDDLSFAYAREMNPDSLMQVALYNNEAYLKTKMAGTLYFHNDSFLNTGAPESFSDWPIPLDDLDYPIFECTRLIATVYTNSNNLSMEGTEAGKALFDVTTVTDWSKVDSEARFVQYTPDNTKSLFIYFPNQDVNKDSDVIFNKIESKVDIPELLYINQPGDEGDIPVRTETGYLIFATPNTSGEVFKDNKSLVTEKTLGYWDGAVIIDEEGNTENNITKLGTVTEGEWQAGPITTESADIGELSVDNIEASGDVHIAGDLTVDGKTTTVHTEEVTTESNTITLRDGATTAIQPGEVSGIEIENYDGNGTTLQVAVDNEGTLRIGTDIGSSEGDNEPILTRSESTDLIDQHILIWDASKYKAVDSGETVDGILKKSDDEVSDETGWTSKKITDYIDSHMQSMPIGTVLVTPMEVAPRGYLICDGSEYRKSDYPRLYDALPEVYHMPGGVTFRVPDYRDRYVKGANGDINTTKGAGLPNISGNFGTIVNTSYKSYEPAKSDILFRPADWTVGTIYGKQDASSSGTKVYGYNFDASRVSSVFGKSDTVTPETITQNFIIKATAFSEIESDILNDAEITGANVWSAKRVFDYVNSVGAGLPVGAVVMSPADSLYGFLECDGSTYRRADYPDLWDVLPSTFKNNDGTFRVPNFKNRYVRGANTQTENNSLFDAGLPNITGGLWTRGFRGKISLKGGGGSQYGALQIPDDDKYTTWSGSHAVVQTEMESDAWTYKLSFDASKSNNIYGKANTVRPDTIVQKFFIKAFNPVVDETKIYKKTFTISETIPVGKSTLSTTEFDNVGEILYQKCVSTTIGTEVWKGGLVDFRVKDGNIVLFNQEDEPVSNTTFYIEYKR